MSWLWLCATGRTGSQGIRFYHGLEISLFDALLLRSMLQVGLGS